MHKSSPRLHLQIPSFVDKKGGSSFGYRSEVSFIETSPGPVYYLGEKEDERRAQKNYQRLNGFGSSPKLGGKLNKSLEPGPGSYQQIRKSATASGWSFSRSPKKDRIGNDNPVGPGEYNVYLKYDSNSPKIKGKYSPPKEVTYDAAPGSYDIPDTKTKKGTVFKAHSSSGTRKEHFDSPSPFSYESNTSTLKKNGFTLGVKLNPVNQTSFNPGPGTYEVSENLEDKVGGYMSRKFEQKKKASDTQDNFYKYNPKTDSVSYKYPQYTFSAQQTLLPEKEAGLGPGNYFILEKNKGEAYTFGKNSRFGSSGKDKASGETLSKKDYYSTLGYLPSYLKPKQQEVDMEKSQKSKSPEKDEKV